MAILQLLHTVKVTNDTNSQIFEFGNKQIKFRQLQQSVTFGHNSELNCGISTFFSSSSLQWHFRYAYRTHEKLTYTNYVCKS